MGNSTVPPPKKMGTVLTSKQPAILGYQNITFDSSILTLYSSNITCDDTFVTFGGFLFFFFFFSQLMVSSSHCAVLTLHVIILLSHFVVPLSFCHI